jgi:hypothetical protein
MTAVAAGDRWLFLTPEVEALLPDAAAALAAALRRGRQRPGLSHRAPPPRPGRPASRRARGA